jgi:hypothetical protein
VQQQIGPDHLFQRGAERHHQIVWQPVDKTDGIGDQHPPRVAQLHGPHQRVERGEQRR